MGTTCIDYSWAAANQIWNHGLQIIAIHPAMWLEVPEVYEVRESAGERAGHGRFRTLRCRIDTCTSMRKKRDSSVNGTVHHLACVHLTHSLFEVVQSQQSQDVTSHWSSSINFHANYLRFCTDLVFPILKVSQSDITILSVCYYSRSSSIAQSDIYSLFPLYCNHKGEIVWLDTLTSWTSCWLALAYGHPMVTLWDLFNLDIMTSSTVFNSGLSFW